MSSSNNSTDQPIANEAGIGGPLVPNEDPYRALDDLMVVIEALCPVWPQRDTFDKAAKMLL